MFLFGLGARVQCFPGFSTGEVVGRPLIMSVEITEGDLAVLDQSPQLTGIANGDTFARTRLERSELLPREFVRAQRVAHERVKILIVQDEWSAMNIAGEILGRNLLFLGARRASQRESEKRSE